jgi:hypothetical protein
VAAVFGTSPLVVGALLFVWGGSVVADSAQFSAALSDAADPRYVGTALTLQTSIGFLVSVGSIQAFSKLVELVGFRGALPLLTLGPVTGAWAMLRLRRTARRDPLDAGAHDVAL